MKSYQNLPVVHRLLNSNWIRSEKQYDSLCLVAVIVFFPLSVCSFASVRLCYVWLIFFFFCFCSFFFSVCYTFLTIFHHFFNKYIYPCAFSAVTVSIWNACVRLEHSSLLCATRCVHTYKTLYIYIWALGCWTIFPFHFIVRFSFWVMIIIIRTNVWQKQNKWKCSLQIFQEPGFSNWETKFLYGNSSYSFRCLIQLNRKMWFSDEVFTSLL